MSKPLWRSLEERAEDPAFLQQLQHEFPQLLAAGTFSTNRRQFLKLMGAMLSMAGLAGCSPQALGTPVIRDQVFIGTAIPMDTGTVPPRVLLASGD